MRGLLVQNQETAFERAHLFYTAGANSMSVAKLTLEQELLVGLPKGTELAGKNDSGKAINGTISADTFPGDLQILFQYQVGSGDDRRLVCRVGARPVGEQELGGCLQKQGHITTSLGSMSYLYDPFTDNVNARTLQSLSLDANSLMNDCPNCPYGDFRKVRTASACYDCDSFISRFTNSLLCS